MKSKKILFLAAASLAVLAGCQDDANRHGHQGVSCDAPLIACGETCIDPLSDDNFCGANEACENYIACPLEYKCTFGQCKKGDEIWQPCTG